MGTIASFQVGKCTTRAGHGSCKEGGQVPIGTSLMQGLYKSGIVSCNHGSGEVRDGSVSDLPSNSNADIVE